VTDETRRLPPELAGDGPGEPERPASGEGRVRIVDQVALRLGILRGLAEFLARQTGKDGVLRCPRHRVEHTGKNVYAAVLDLYNWLYTREELYLERARLTVLRAVDNLGPDPGSGVPVFLPGRVDPRNASTNSIDGGACADSIATLLEEAPHAFSATDRQRCTDALTQHVEGYLRHAAREKGITAQRLWAATGVARAARLLGRKDWAADALAGCRLALEELAPDGVSPYVPAGAPECTHPGLADTSTFYHSRTPGFVLYVHEVLGEPLTDRARERLGAALDALVALRGGNGRKLLHNEAKAWYWTGDYEVASHAFDVWALHKGAQMLGRPLYRNEAGRAMEEWLAHIGPDGGVHSRHGRGTDFQCRIFWTAHAAWIARVLHEVPLTLAPRPPLTLDLQASGLVHVERARCVAVLRGRHARAGNLFGCDRGGGALQSLVVRSDPRQPQGEELVHARRFDPRPEGEFALRLAGGRGRLARLARVLSADRSDLKFRLFVARVEWGAHEWFGALAYPVRHAVARSWREASPWLASHRDLATTQRVEGDVVEFEGGLADRDGERAQGVTTRRRYTFLAERLELHDELRLAGVRGEVRYRLPRALRDVSVQASGATARTAGGQVVLRANGGDVVLAVRGHYPLA
jgi:hypothetical protein